MELYVKNRPKEDEKDAGGLWDLAAELEAIAAKCGQEEIYNFLCEQIHEFEEI